MVKKETTEIYSEEEIVIIEERSEALTEESPVENAEQTSEETKENPAETSDESEATEETREEGAETAPKKFIIKLPISGLYLYLAIAVLAFAIVLTVILLLPSTRSKRALKKADAKYIVEEFSEALPLYEKSFTLKKDKVKAYLGYLLSDKALNNEDTAEKYLAFFETLKEINISDSDKGVLNEFFLLAPEMLSDDYEKIIEVLEYAMENSDETGDLKNPLADAYFKAGLEKKDSDIDEALSMYDKALALSDSAESMIFDVSEAVLVRIRMYLGSDDFEAARACLSKYAETLKLDASGEEALISDAEAIFETKRTLLTDVYNAMEPYYTQYKDTFAENFPSEEEPIFRAFLYDWSRMMEIDGSYNAQTVANSGASNAYCFSPDGFSSDFTGKACGVYTFGDAYVDSGGNSTMPYYFYFGDYKNGKRDGYGVIFIGTASTSYDVFEGTWVDDKPEGFGGYYSNDMYDYTSLAKLRMLTYGNFSSGLQDGEMTVLAVMNEQPDTYFKSTYEAKMGYVEPLLGDPIEHGIVTETPEGCNLIATVASVADGNDYFVAVYAKEGALKGVYGFN